MLLEDIIGQEEVIGKLKAFSDFHTSHGTMPGHILLTGDPDMGQTAIGIALANGLNVGIQMAKAEDFKNQGDLTAVLTNLRERQVLMITGIEALQRLNLERLSTVLRDRKLEVSIGTGRALRLHIFDVRPFTLIATCLRRLDCPKELLGEFSLDLNLRPYTTQHLQAIAIKLAGKAQITLDEGASLLIAKYCDGGPRGVSSLLQRLERAINSKVLSEGEVIGHSPLSECESIQVPRRAN